MNRDYSVLLGNLLTRRYDEARRESIVSDAFEECGYADVLRYTLECMQEIDPSYAYKTFHLAKKIQDKIADEFVKRDLKVDFRYQGSIQTETHVVLYGGVELLVIVEPTDAKPWRKVTEVTQHLMDILTGEPNFKEVNYSSKQRIKLTTLKPTCEINVLPAVWLNNPEWISHKREIDRGICEFNLANKTLRRYLPFLNIARLNSRDNRCNGGIKKMVRLLRSLQRDAHEYIELTNYELCALVYGIPEKQMRYDKKNALSLLGVLAAQLNRVVTDTSYREKLVSPSEKELVFGNKPEKLDNLKKLKRELDMLLADLQTELRKDGKTIYSEISY